VLLPAFWLGLGEELCLYQGLHELPYGLAKLLRAYLGYLGNLGNNLINRLILKPILNRYYRLVDKIRNTLLIHKKQLALSVCVL
jgi:hypothetical protein